MVHKKRPIPLHNQCRCRFSISHISRILATRVEAGSPVHFLAAKLRSLAAGSRSSFARLKGNLRCEKVQLFASCKSARTGFCSLAERTLREAEKGNRFWLVKSPYQCLTRHKCHHSFKSSKRKGKHFLRPRSARGEAERASEKRSAENMHI